MVNAVPKVDEAGSIAGFMALLLLACLTPLFAAAHESAPVLPEEDSAATVAGHPHVDNAGDARDTGGPGEQPGPAQGDHSAHGMDDRSGHGMHKAETVRADMAGHDMGEDGDGSMTHPGLPTGWILSIMLVSTAIFGWAVGAEPPTQAERSTWNLSTAPVLGPVVTFLNASPVPLFILKVLTVAAFILVVFSGFFGVVYPERNLATVLVWNWWWPLVIVSVLFVGTAWCAICPWNSLASWIVRRRLWRRVFPHPGLNRKVPKYLRNVWMALLLFIGLTWLELGVGVTSIPKATAMMALAMFGLSFTFLILFERNAFCRYACPVGRTIGFYSRLAPIALRPKVQKACDSCTTMECYRGSDAVEPCPSSLTIGRFSQNTYCLSCGNCALSCPHKNVTWRLRPMGSEAMSEALPTWDGAWFMLILLGITIFHGTTMLPVWTDVVVWIARAIGETGKLVWSFSLGMFAGFAIPVIIYAAAIMMTIYVVGWRISFKRLFVALPFATLPLAFTYHLAHNVDHLFREGGGVLTLFFNPLGIGLSSMTGTERHENMMNTVPDGLVFAAQAALITLGVWLAVYILRHRAAGILPRNKSIKGWHLTPMLAFVAIITGINLWLLSQEMVMRF